MRQARSGLHIQKHRAADYARRTGQPILWVSATDIARDAASLSKLHDIKDRHGDKGVKEEKLRWLQKHDKDAFRDGNRIRAFSYYEKITIFVFRFS